MPAKLRQCSVRLDAETRDRIETVRVAMGPGWREATTSDTTRALILSALAYAELHGTDALLALHESRKEGQASTRTAKNKAGKRRR